MLRPAQLHFFIQGLVSPGGRVIEVRTSECQGGYSGTLWSPRPSCCLRRSVFIWLGRSTATVTACSHTVKQEISVMFHYLYVQLFLEACAHSILFVLLAWLRVVATCFVVWYQAIFLSLLPTVSLNSWSTISRTFLCFIL